MFCLDLHGKQNFHMEQFEKGWLDGANTSTLIHMKSHHRIDMCHFQPCMHYQLNCGSLIHAPYPSF